MKQIKASGYTHKKKIFCGVFFIVIGVLIGIFSNEKMGMIVFVSFGILYVIIGFCMMQIDPSIYTIENASLSAKLSELEETYTTGLITKEEFDLKREQLLESL